jgi:hypothetical protein
LTKSGIVTKLSEQATTTTTGHDMNNLTPEEILAIMKAVSTKESKEARSAIENDSQVEVNTLVRVKGILKRGQAFNSKGTSRIPWKTAIALLLKRSGVTGPGSIELLTEAIRDAVAMNKDARDALLNENGIGDALQIVDKELCEKLPPIQKDGNISFAASVVEAVREPTLVADEIEDNDKSGTEAAK